MSQRLQIHPDNPQHRLLKQAAQILHDGGVAAVPTDSSYALVCRLDDKAAVDMARGLMLPFPPSSPSVALFKDGELVHMVERHHIEGRSAEALSMNLAAAFDEYCN
jgi:putative YphP/YqiW family bacilliredoxin